MLGEHSKSFSHVLQTSRMGYRAGKPIESVVYCLNKVKNTKSYIINNKSYNESWCTY